MEGFAPRLPLCVCTNSAILNYGGLGVGFNLGVLYGELVLGIPDLTARCTSHVCAWHRIQDLDFAAVGSHQFPDCLGGATGLIKGRSREKFFPSQFTPMASRTSDSDLGLGFDDRRRLRGLRPSRLHCSCGFVTLATALAYGSHCRCGMATSLTACKISMAAAAADVGGGKETSDVGARRPLRTLFGRHGPFARRSLHGEQRASADVRHIHANSIPLARLLWLVRPWQAEARKTTVIRGA